jgi:hypothetical protein
MGGVGVHGYCYPRGIDGRVAGDARDVVCLRCRWMMERVRVMRTGIWGREPGETGVISTITKIEFHGYGSVWGIRGGLRHKRSRICPEVTVCGLCGGNKLGFLWVLFLVLTWALASCFVDVDALQLGDIVTLVYWTDNHAKNTSYGANARQRSLRNRMFPHHTPTPRGGEEGNSPRASYPKRKQWHPRYHRNIVEDATFNRPFNHRGFFRAFYSSRGSRSRLRPEASRITLNGGE